MSRIDGRRADELRRFEVQPGFTTNPAGSALVRAGRTMVLCTACVEESVPRFRVGQGGWMTAEYQMAPGSTHTRMRREAGNKVKGRTHEIQRLIGRSLRAGIDLDRLGEVTINVDCEVLQADGGTRTASITGGWIAMALAIDSLLTAGTIESNPLTGIITAVSCGVVDGACLLDLPYEEDARAEVDMNLVMRGDDEIVEVQATGEGGVLRRADLNSLIDVGIVGIAELRKAQIAALGTAAGRLGLA